ncbi:MAG: four helix bundle protein [Chlorobiota bacterium]|nr:MAG: four helix bundle protein [Chlorobiota bacterium]
MNVLADKSLKFGVRIYKLCKYLDEKKEFIISKQILRCGTSIGANIHEAIHAESELDYIHKYAIAINSDAEELMRLLVTSLKTMKSKINIKRKKE